MKQSLFHAKVLLFGEYGILENSSGLSIPHDSYQGTLKFQSTSSREFFSSNLELEKYFKFLFFLEKNKNLVSLNLKKLYEDIQKGIFFYSNIPQKYGIGSSGALVAAIYEKYAISKLKKCTKKHENIINLRKIFSQMESFFHGKSSGIDPLICYLNIPLLIRSETNISSIRIPTKRIKKGKGAIFLLDSGKPSKTSSMIKFFLEKLKHDKFRKILKEEFIKYNEKCIETFLKGDFKVLLKHVKLLSAWVFHHFRPMIPKNFLKIWEEGLFTNIHYLKLCGSGGGGFLLVFTPNYDLSIKKLKKYTTEVLFRF
ncbi:mevalonate kinase family protein [Blattabacterium cuenoti]|uniref:mevalonate kinase family protein n=1 Tax=Blattabacterium cuenoti TaxID=1653831 RepID=UPI00163C3AEA|nr:mevalonate kinase [Blattabacterium cuenoti]